LHVDLFGKQRGREDAAEVQPHENIMADAAGPSHQSTRPVDRARTRRIDVQNKADSCIIRVNKRFVHSG
jgi:hypothetical protein